MISHSLPVVLAFWNEFLEGRESVFETRIRIFNLSQSQFLIPDSSRSPIPYLGQGEGGLPLTFELIEPFGLGQGKGVETQFPALLGWDMQS